ncbi:hypothetical protein F4802DRAFT_464897 [Xylaria palmicola]|nr:hypothetical protein F4802DRAFT_464897 [Xylaria palmicola]
MAQEPTILPKGIVLNRDAVYEEIAKYDTIPVEQILRAYHVFSTTSRELYDPTARRLENFWTRVLGGDRRLLSGKVIARLFKDISEGTPFVKLLGPRNRYEPPSPKSSESKAQSAQETTLAPISNLNTKSTTSVKSPHPILKKPRGPSKGPRPTARFVSPPESGITKNKIEQSQATAISANVIDSAAPRDLSDSASIGEPKKGMATKPKKKTTAFVASTSRRRPGMPRRSSSQSSAGASDIAAKEGDSSQSSVPTIPEQSGEEIVSARKGKSVTSLSAKAAGKRPMNMSRAEVTASRPGNLDNNETLLSEQGNVKTKQLNPSRSIPKGKAAETSGSRSKTPLSVGGQRSDNPQHRYPESSPSMNRSSSDVGSARQVSREAGRPMVPSSSLMSSTPAKLDTSVIGQGTISVLAERVPSHDPSRGLFGGAAHSAATQNSGGRQMTPPQQKDTAVIPLSRSKSQLTLLLDRKPEKKPRS